jgi:hypothetical protein
VSRNIIRIKAIEMFAETGIKVKSWVFVIWKVQKFRCLTDGCNFFSKDTTLFFTGEQQFDFFPNINFH